MDGTQGSIYASVLNFTNMPEDMTALTFTGVDLDLEFDEADAPTKVYANRDGCPQTFRIITLFYDNRAIAYQLSIASHVYHLVQCNAGLGVLWVMTMGVGAVRCGGGW